MGMTVLEHAHGTPGLFDYSCDREGCTRHAQVRGSSIPPGWYTARGLPGIPGGVFCCEKHGEEYQSQHGLTGRLIKRG
jgi:hypothetical protein